jgi:flagellar biosynthesis/type III secretory pathway chaperone
MESEKESLLNKIKRLEELIVDLEKRANLYREDNKALLQRIAELQEKKGE